ncbi:uncharacterized protein LOC123265304 [Cotesia glomerata]|uniref:uncharacterized protein LOC123265304 n=1 Tax=Cotesia glomerata TaxID=32391 RepID=UPI001D0180AC|nr:uncharacterized protein LOC123265304 [Cotesia glomerata]
MKEDTFTQNLIKQNELDNIKSNFSLVKIWRKFTTDKGYGSIILEVCPAVHDILLQNGQVKIGWKKCWGFHHTANKCSKNETCRRCAEQHNEKDCSNDTVKWLEQRITEPTRITLHSDTIIDLVFTNCNAITKVLTSPRISDHNIIMFNIAKKSQQMVDVEKYKKLRNEVVKDIRDNKTKYYEQQIDQNKTNSKLMWKSLKDLIGGKNKLTTFDIVNFNGNIVSDHTKIANKLNQYFIDSVELIIKDINFNELNINFNDNFAVKWDEFETVTSFQLDKIIKGLDDNKGTKLEINAVTIKYVWESEKDIILLIINNSLNLGLVPDNWKTSIITPIQKVKDSIKVEELRPINVLPVYEQILEEVVKLQLLNYVNSNDILFDEQSGFRVNYSCETALQHSFIEWRKNLDDGLLTGVVFIDFAKAFETINRKLLLHKLKKLGISGTVLNWFRSYLSGRKQKVKFGNVVSEEFEIKYGVPQEN